MKPDITKENYVIINYENSGTGKQLLVGESLFRRELNKLLADKKVIKIYLDLRNIR